MWWLGWAHKWEVLTHYLWVPAVWKVLGVRSLVQLEILEASQSFACDCQSSVAWDIHCKLETGSDSVVTEEQQKEMSSVEILQVCCLSKIISSPALLLPQRWLTLQPLFICWEHLNARANLYKSCPDMLRLSVRRSIYASWQQQEGCGQGHPPRIPAWREYQRLTRGCLVALHLKVWSSEVKSSECL